MKTKRSAKELLLSPYIFLIFLIPPIVVVTLRSTGHNSHTLDVLLVNNGLLLCYLCFRLNLLLRRRFAPLQYAPDPQPPHGVKVPVPRFLLKERLERTGYRFDASGRYGEKKSVGFDGMILAHAALILLLGFGMYDNLRQLDGTILLGVGEPLKLYEPKAYGILTEGPLASVRETGMKLQIRKQQLPSPEWPAGASEALLLSPEGKELQQGMIAPGHPMRQGGFVINMNRLLYDAWVVITTAKNEVLYTGFVKLLPAGGKRGGYSHYGEFGDQFLKVAGRVWIDPPRKAIRVEASRRGRKIVDTELLLWGGNRKEQDGYVVKFEGLGEWSELHVTRYRHRWALVTGVGLALLGFALRLLFPTKRVRLDDEGSGTMLHACDKKLISRTVQNA